MKHFLVLIFLYSPILLFSQLNVNSKNEQLEFRKKNKVAVVEKYSMQSKFARLEFDFSGLLQKFYHDYPTDSTIKYWDTFEYDSLGREIKRYNHEIILPHEIDAYESMYMGKLQEKNHAFDTLISVTEYDYKGTKWVMGCRVYQADGGLLSSYNTRRDTLNYSSYTVTKYRTNRGIVLDTTYGKVDTIKRTVTILQYDNKHKPTIKTVYILNEAGLKTEMFIYKKNRGSKELNLLEEHSIYEYSEEGTLIYEKNIINFKDMNTGKMEFNQSEYRYDKYGTITEYIHFGSSPDKIKSHFIFENKYRPDMLLESVTMRHEGGDIVEKITYEYEFY